MSIKSFLKNGLSGIMCIKNEASFLETCIDSCIDALDELIVVFIKGNDNSEEILSVKKNQYGDKLLYYEYPHEVLWFEMTRQEYEMAAGFPEDDPRLYSSMCNFALSKVNYKYVIKKIDADQFYFTDELRVWRDMCAKPEATRFNIICLIGFIFDLYISLYRRLSMQLGRPLTPLIPDAVCTMLRKPYLVYAKWRLMRKEAAISLSGINVLYDDGWFIPFDGVNIHPPYNGEGDHIIFPLSSETFFTKHVGNRAINRATYSITEDFHHPYRTMFGGFCWFHMHANRKHCRAKVVTEKVLSPHLFVPVDEFQHMSYQQILTKMAGKIDVLYKKIYFSIAHKLFSYQFKDNIYRLTSYIKGNEI